ncbi:hypothetical protein BC832DRAFT_543016 [Gaertneriomyces semiglobifer]|nr:hypothetical protein BC832DRAFT_543016 [Gaertneriomyces semiglobifer]
MVLNKKQTESRTHHYSFCKETAEKSTTSAASLNTMLRRQFDFDSAHAGERGRPIQNVLWAERAIQVGTAYFRWYPVISKFFGLGQSRKRNVGYPIERTMRKQCRSQCDSVNPGDQKTCLSWRYLRATLTGIWMTVFVDAIKAYCPLLSKIDVGYTPITQDGISTIFRLNAIKIVKAAGVNIGGTKAWENVERTIRMCDRS